MKKEQSIRKKIEQIKQEIANLGDMRPGLLTRQTRSWGKVNWQLSYTHRGRGMTGYVSEGNYDRVKTQTENYRRFKGWYTELVDLALELVKLTDNKSGSCKSRTRYSQVKINKSIAHNANHKM